MHDTATGAGYNIAGAKGITAGRKGYKSALFEGGIGVPFIARWPGRIAAGAVNDTSLISAVDLLPTFCDVAGVKLPSGYLSDGLSQLSALTGDASQLTATRSKPLFWKMKSAWPIRRHQPYHWVSYAIVDDHWKLMTNRDSSYTELYDIAIDPLEKTDLAQRQPDTVARLLARIEDWKNTLPAEPTGDVFSVERQKLK